MTEQKMIDGDALLEWLRGAQGIIRDGLGGINGLGGRDETIEIEEVVKKIEKMKEEMRGQTTPC